MAAIIAGSLYSALRTGFRARASAEEALEPIRTAAVATSLLRADFESALPADGTLAGPFLGVDGTGDGGQQSDTVEFITLGNPSEAYAVAALAAPGSDGLTGLSSSGLPATPALPAEARKVQIGLVVSPGPGGRSEQVLVRRITTNLLSLVDVEPQEEVLCRGVRSLGFRYHDGLTWQDSWDSTLLDNHIPAAVEMVIELDRSADGRQRIIQFPRVFLLACSTVANATTSATDTVGEGGTP